MANKFVNRNEYVFVTFDDVLCSVAPGILKMLQTPSYRKGFENYIDYSKFENLNDLELNYFCMKRRNINILDEVKKIPFDTSTTLIDILGRHREIYPGAEYLSMVSSLKILARHSFTKKLYIYNENDDNEDIAYCIIRLFHDMDNVVFVTGDFKEAITHTEEQPTLYVLNDVNRVYDIVESKRANYSDILVANYGYNYTYDEEQKIPVLKITDVDKLSKSEIFRLNMFMPFNKNQLQVIKKSDSKE